MLKKIKIPLALAGLILAVRILLPFHIHIENVVSGELADGYNIAISPLRILFEPILGPLLYAIRADQPLVEFFTAMLWLMAIMLPLLIYRYGKSSSPGRIILKWLALLPVILALWIALLIVLVFAPLPANRIVNFHKDTILLNIHSHTHWSHDGLISPQGLMEWHRKNGFDAFFVTEHNHHAKTLELIKQQDEGVLPAEPLILPGQEYSGSNHILLLGLQRDFRTKDMPDSTAIDSAQANGGVAIIAHWFADEKKSLDYYIDQGGEGFEIINQSEGLTYDRDIFNQIVETCKQLNLLMLGSCDYHGYGSAAFSWNALRIPGWQSLDIPSRRRAVMEILRNHDQEKITVLAYRDRSPFPRKLVLLSPLLNTVGYFRTLNFWQLLSWIFWLFALALLFPGKLIYRASSLKCWAGLGLAASLVAIAEGVQLLSNAKAVAGFNEIYQEYGQIFLWAGIVLLVWSSILIIWKLKKD